MSLKQNLLGLTKNVFLLLKINSKFIVAPTISKILWPLPLMLILDCISSTLKPFYILFWEWKMVWKLIKSANSFHIWISVYIIKFLYVYKLHMNTFIYTSWLHKRYVHKTVSKVLPNLPIPASSTATATFCLIMDKLFDICHECQQHNSELKPLEAPFLSTDNPRFLWLKYQILMFFEDCLKTIDVRSEVYEKPEKQKIFTFNQKSIKSIQSTYYHGEQAYKVFDYA